MKFAASLVCLLLASCASTGRGQLPVDDAILPSDVIRNHASLDGHIVKISGYLVAKFEDRGIWDSKGKYEKYDSSASCVSLLIPKSALAEIEGNSGKRVVMEGKVVADLRRRGTVVLGICNFVAVEVQNVVVIETR